MTAGAATLPRVADAAQVVPDLASTDCPGLVVDLTSFDGYPGLAAFREDAEMDTANRNDFSRIAVIGNSKWMKWGTSLASTLTCAEMRWFDSGGAETAKEWARQV